MQFRNSCQASRDRGPFGREGLSFLLHTIVSRCILAPPGRAAVFFIAQVLEIFLARASFMTGKCLTCAFGLGGVQTQRAGHPPAVLKGASQ
jgi:hypothetical protein